jgi:hypothetical protein
MQAVIVPARQQRPDHKAHVASATQDSPAQDHLAALAGGDDLLRHLGAVLCPERPHGPGLGAEAGDPRMAVGMHHVRCIALGGQREATPLRLDPGLDAVDQHDPAGGRRGGRQEQRVIASRAYPRDGAGGEAALPIGLEPFCVRRITDAPRRHGVAPFWFRHPILGTSAFAGSELRERLPPRKCRSALDSIDAAYYYGVIRYVKPLISQPFPSKMLDQNCQNCLLKSMV